MNSTRKTRFALLVTLLIVLSGIGLGPLVPSAALAANVDIVFVARAHLATRDDVFNTEVGPAGQFGSGLPKFAPGSKLMIRHADSTLTTLVDGSNPSAANGYLIDVQSPDVSLDATKIVFAGATTVDPTSAQYGWRLYEINVNGSGLHKINVANRSFTTVPNNNPNNYDFGDQETYGWWNDLFPAYLADGRIVFSSTRYPSRAHYDDRHTYNLYVMNGDGSNVHRITTEHGSVLNPTPLPDGRIVVARWWLNFNQPGSTDIYNRIDNRSTDKTLADGTIILANTNEDFNPALGRLPNGFDIREAPNAWHLFVIDPDGANFHRVAFTPYNFYSLTQDDGNDTYTAAQPTVVQSGGQTYLAYTSQQDSSMVHTTQETGIRVARQGAPLMYANVADAIAGLTFDKAWNQNDTSAPYALHPWGMPDGTILFSYASSYNNSLPSSGTYVDRVTGASFHIQGSNLQYSLYTMDLAGNNKTVLPVSIGTADAIDAKPISARSGWSSKSDNFASVANDDPRYGNIPNTLPQYPFSQNGPGQIQTATIHNPNIYANPGLDQPFINNSPPAGSIAFAQVYIDANQFTGAYCYGPYPPDPCDTFKADNRIHAVRWTQVPVSQQGEFSASIPADTPAFIVLRDRNGRAVSGWNRGYISIAQGNAYARPGQTVTCIGCHFGHVSGSLDSVMSDVVQGLTNLAPNATVTASSYCVCATDDQTAFLPSHLNDRRGWVPVPAGGPGGPFQDQSTGWISDKGKAVGEWARLDWTSLMHVSKVHLVGPLPTGGDWDGFENNYHITSGTLHFYAGGTEVGAPVNVGQVQPLTNSGTWVTLTTPRDIDRMTFVVNSVSGDWYGNNVAALNEIEVIGTAGGVPSPQNKIFLPFIIH